jgi:hypothetical protein
MPRLHLIARFALLGIVVLTGCAHPDGKNAAIAPRPPSPESVTIELGIDLGRLDAHTAPLLRPSSASLPDALLAPLRPLLTDPIPTLVTLGDVVKYDGRFPGEHREWSKWDQGMEKLVRQNQVAGKLVEYEMWNEPDRASSWKGNQAEFFLLWVHTARLMRSIDPGIALVGPSIAKHDSGWIQEFCKIGKELDCPPTIVCWHENSVRPDLPGHVTGTAEGFWQDGTDRQRLRVLPSAALDRGYAPADPILLLAAMQQAYRDTKMRGIDERFGIKLHHLITKEQQPRSLYHAYTAYADLVQAGGRVVKLSSSKTVDGLATWQAPARTVRVVLGRNVARSAATQPTTRESPAKPGPLTLVLKNVRGAAARVSLSTIADSGDKASTLGAAQESELPVSHGEIRLPLPDFDSGQVCQIEFRITGNAATTQATTKP